MSNPDRRVHASETCIGIMVAVLAFLAVVGTIRLVWP